MKNKIEFTLILIILSVLWNNKTNAQIVLEHTFPYGPNSPEDVRMQLTDIGNNEYKFVYTNYTTNQLIVLNMDYSNYLTINVPITLSSENKYWIGYVTKSLFDCDTSNIEYAIMPSVWFYNFYVYRQDGTLLLEKDSTIAPWSFGCFEGSYDIRPIINSPLGAKLFLLPADGSGLYKTTEVYSLCGKLPEGIKEMNTSSITFVKEYPNPSSGEIEFQFQLPSNIQDYELVFYNSSGQLINKIKIKGTTTNYRMEEKQLSSGQYFYTLSTENKILQTGKFMIAR